MMLGGWKNASGSFQICGTLAAIISAFDILCRRVLEWSTYSRERNEDYCEHYCIIDYQAVWYGSMNFLG